VAGLGEKRVAVLKRGLVQVYTGDGKGKSTAALGLAWRMLGHGGAVYICQFLKSGGLRSGEVRLIETLAGGVTLERIDEPWDMARGFEDARQVRRMSGVISAKLAQIRPLASAGRYDLVILDEIVLCIARKLARREDVFAIMDGRAGHVELVLTGRGADDELMDRADLVTRMEAVKHPFSKGLPARAGIEY